MSGDTSEERRERVLRERAERLAKQNAHAAREEADFEVALCRVGQERIGLPVERLQEIVPLPALARLPGTPAWLLGIAQLRGALISVVDLGGLLGFGTGGDARFVAVVGGDDGPIAFTIDEVLAYRRVFASDLTQSGESTGDGKPVLGVTQDLAAVIDVEALLARPELVVE